jgi:hypothetical protein
VVIEHYKNVVAEGYIVYEDRNRSYREEFKIDFGEFADVPLFAQEDLKTHYELQKIPGKIETLAVEIERLREMLARSTANAATGESLGTTRATK